MYNIVGEGGVVELTTGPRGPGIDSLLSDDGGIGGVLLDAGGFERGDLPPSAPSPAEDALRERSRDYINHWTEDQTAGEFVVSALITAYKPEAE